MLRILLKMQEWVPYNNDDEFISLLMFLDPLTLEVLNVLITYSNKASQTDPDTIEAKLGNIPLAPGSNLSTPQYTTQMPSMMPSSLTMPPPSWIPPPMSSIEHQAAMMKAAKALCDEVDVLKRLLSKRQYVPYHKDDEFISLVVYMDPKTHKVTNELITYRHKETQTVPATVTLSTPRPPAAEVPTTTPIAPFRPWMAVPPLKRSPVEERLEAAKTLCEFSSIAILSAKAVQTEAIQPQIKGKGKGKGKGKRGPPKPDFDS